MVWVEEEPVAVAVEAEDGELLAVVVAWAGEVEAPVSVAVVAAVEVAVAVAVARAVALAGAEAGLVVEAGRLKLQDN